MKKKGYRLVLCLLIPLLCLGILCTSFGMIYLNQSDKNKNKTMNAVSSETGVSLDASLLEGSKGGAIYLGAGSSYTMTSGTISGSAATYGGAVYVASGATFTMTGGTITANRAKLGGAIYVEEGGNVLISGGEVTGNFAEEGLGIYAVNPNDVTIDGTAKIRNNQYAVFATEINYYVNGEFTNSIYMRGVYSSDGAPLDYDHCIGYYTDPELTIPFNDGESLNEISTLNLYTIEANSSNLQIEEIASTTFTRSASASSKTYKVKGSITPVNGTLIVPKTYNGGYITTIGQSAFLDCATLTGFKLPATIISIEANAFTGTGLTGELNLYEGLVSVGVMAFSNTTISSISIPESLTALNSGAFGGCTNLEEITIDENNTKYVFENGFLVEQESSTILGGINVGAAVVIPEGTTKVGDYAYSYSNITGVTFPSSLKEIGVRAFEGCSGLTSIVIPASVEVTRHHCFYICNNLESAVVEPNSNLKIMENSTFSGCISLKSFEVPKSVTELWEAAFIRCYGLESITFEEGSQLTTLKPQVFRTCTSLKEIELPNTITAIGWMSLAECTALERVVLPDELLKISDQMFQNDINLKEVVIKDKVTTIGKGIFNNCESLKTVSLPNGIKTLQEYTFGNTAITHFTLPTSLTKIEYEAFSGCTDLTGLYIPKTVKTVEQNIFLNCSASLSVTCEAATKPTGWVDNWSVVNTETGGTITPTWNVTTDPAFVVSGTTLAAYNGTNKELVIPNTVTAIADDFTTLVKITSVVIPSTVTRIGARAFVYQTELSSITIEEGVQTIGANAFENTNIKEIHIPSSVTTIEGDGNYPSSLFLSCSTDLVVYCGAETIPSGWNSAFASEEGYSFEVKWGISKEVYKDQLSYVVVDNVLIEYKGTASEVVIPNGVTEIASGVFKDNLNLSIVTIPETVVTIGAEAFYGCQNLTKINYKAIAVEDLSTSAKAFYNAGVTSGAIDVVVSEKVSKIPANLFNSAEENRHPRIKNLTFIGADNEIETSLTTIGDNAFRGVFPISSITIPNSVISIGNNAFRAASAATSLIFEETSSLEIIGEWAFSYTAGLTKVVIPASVNQISKSAFNAASNIKELTFAEGSLLTTIQSQAFFGISIGSFIAPSNLTSIGWGAFTNCYSLHTVVLNEGITKLNDQLFLNCTGLKSVTIPTSVTSTGKKIFMGCTSLQTVDLPNGITTLNESVFENSGIVSVTLPSKLTTIKYNAFKNCANLSYIELPSTLKTIEYNAFEGCTSLVQIYIPSSVTTMGATVFYGCTSTMPIICGATSQPNGWDSTWRSYDGTNNLLVTWATDKTAYVANNAYVVDSEGELVKYLGSETNVVVGNAVTTSAFTSGTSVTSIGAFAFKNNATLKEVTIGESITQIGDGAFYGCTALEKVYYNAIEAANLADEMTSVFYNAGTAGEGFEMVVGAKVKKIPDYLCSVYWRDYYPHINKLTFAEDGVLEYIGISAFEHCWELTAVEIPNTVTVLKDHCFYWNFLTSVTFEENSTLKIMENSAFSGNDELTSVIIPASLEEMWEAAFIRCYKLESVTFEEGSKLKLIGPQTFTDCWVLDNVVIPESVEFIDKLTFNRCYALTNIVLPDNLEELTNYMFRDCTGLSSITLPSGLKTFGSYVFTGCSALEHIIVPDGVTTIGDRAFHSSVAKSIVIPASVETMGVNSFFGCGSITIYYKGTKAQFNAISKASSLIKESNVYYYRPDGTPNEAGSNFWGYINGKETILFNEYAVSYDSVNNGYAIKVKTPINAPDYLKIPSEYTGTNGLLPVTAIEANAFYSSSTGSATTSTIVLPSTIVEIRNNAFRQCTNLEDINIPSSVTTIGTHVFRGTTSLKNIVLPEGLTSLGSYAFYQSGITEINIPENITRIETYTFYSCTSLSSVIFEGGVTSVGPYTFYNCLSLLHIEFPESLTILEHRVFHTCNNIQVIILPTSLETIDEKCFHGCSSVKVYYMGTKAQWDSIAKTDIYLADSKVYCYVNNRDEISSAGQYWTYENGEIVTIVQE